MTDPLRALFEHHLPSMSDRVLGGYLEFNGLPACPVWVDDAGKSWTIQERVVEWVLTGRISPTMASVLDKQLHMDTPAPPQKWHQADDAERRRRVRLWLAIQRLQEQGEDVGRLMEKIEPLFKTSFARRPVGFPASGFGEPGDGGWLSYAFEEIQAAQSRSPKSGQDWSGPALAWLESSLLAEPDRLGTWWSLGGVAGTRAKNRQVGSVGWEQPNTLPNPPRWSPFGTTLRPGLLPEQWTSLAVRLVDLAADSLEKTGRFDAVKQLSWLKVVEENPLGAWLTPKLQSSLLRLASAGLLGQPHSALAHHRFDGRSLGALSLLVSHSPDNQWAPPGQQRALAQAVLDHQQAWESSPHPHEKALAALNFAPREALCFQWATEVANAPRPSPRTPRL